MANTVWASERLVFKAVEDEDAAWWKQFVNEDPIGHTNASHFIPIPFGTKSAKGSIEWLKGNFCSAIVCLKPTGDEPKDKDGEPQLTRIGFITLMRPPNLDHHHMGSIAITLAKAYQGKGYGGESLKWILEWGFRHANLHRIEIGVLGWNTGALRLYERVGFVREGVRRKYVWYKGAWWDSYELGMLQEEWVELYGKHIKDE